MSTITTKDGTKNTITTKDGTKIFYKDWGTGQPVVFSHGWPLTADVWDDQMDFFASNGYRGGCVRTENKIPSRVPPCYDKLIITETFG